LFFLRLFDAQHVSFLKESLPITDYFEGLFREAKRQGIPLRDFPHLKQFEEIKAKESQIDFKRAQEEQTRLFLNLTDAHIPQKLTSKNLREKKAFYLRLESSLRAPEARRNPTEKYPELLKYIAYLKAASELDAKKVLAEQEELEDILIRALIQTEDERRLLDAARDHRILESLFNLTLNPDEFRDFSRKENPNALVFLTGFLNKKILELGSYYERALFLEEGFEETQAKALVFYRLTYQRDLTFLERMFAKMDEEGLKKAVLVTGGFHTSNLKSLLKRRNVSYITVIPQILHDTDRGRYERLLLSQGTNGKNRNGSRATTIALWDASVERPETVLDLALSISGSRARLDEVDVKQEVVSELLRMNLNCDAYERRAGSRTKGKADTNFNLSELLTDYLNTRFPKHKKRIIPGRIDPDVRLAPVLTSQETSFRLRNLLAELIKNALAEPWDDDAKVHVSLEKTEEGAVLRVHNEGAIDWEKLRDVWIQTKPGRTEEDVPSNEDLLIEYGLSRGKTAHELGSGPKGGQGMKTIKVQAEILGGTFDFESDPSSGTTMIVTFRLAEAQGFRGPIKKTVRIPEVGLKVATRIDTFGQETPVEAFLANDLTAFIRISEEKGGSGFEAIDIEREVPAFWTPGITALHYARALRNLLLGQGLEISDPADYILIHGFVQSLEIERAPPPDDLFAGFFREASQLVQSGEEEGLHAARIYFAPLQAYYQEHHRRFVILHPYHQPLIEFFCQASYHIRSFMAAHDDRQSLTHYSTFSNATLNRALQLTEYDPKNESLAEPIVDSILSQAQYLVDNGFLKQGEALLVRALRYLSTFSDSFIQSKNDQVRDVMIRLAFEYEASDRRAELWRLALFAISSNRNVPGIVDLTTVRGLAPYRIKKPGMPFIKLHEPISPRKERGPEPAVPTAETKEADVKTAGEKKPPVQKEAEKPETSAPQIPRKEARKRAKALQLELDQIRDEKTRQAFREEHQHLIVYLESMDNPPKPVLHFLASLTRIKEQPKAAKGEKRAKSKRIKPGSLDDWVNQLSRAVDAKETPQTVGHLLGKVRKMVDHPRRQHASFQTKRKAQIDPVIEKAERYLQSMGSRASDLFGDEIEGERPFGLSRQFEVQFGGEEVRVKTRSGPVDLDDETNVLEGDSGVMGEGEEPFRRVGAGCSACTFLIVHDPETKKTYYAHSKTIDLDALETRLQEAIDDFGEISDRVVFYLGGGFSDLETLSRVEKIRERLVSQAEDAGFQVVLALTHIRSTGVTSIFEPEESLLLIEEDDLEEGDISTWEEKVEELRRGIREAHRARALGLERMLREFSAELNRLLTKYGVWVLFQPALDESTEDGYSFTGEFVIASGPEGKLVHHHEVAVDLRRVNMQMFLMDLGQFHKDLDLDLRPDWQAFRDRFQDSKFRRALRRENEIYRKEETGVAKRVAEIEGVPVFRLDDSGKIYARLRLRDKRGVIEGRKAERRAKKEAQERAKRELRKKQREERKELTQLRSEARKLKVKFSLEDSAETLKKKIAPAKAKAEAKVKEVHARADKLGIEYKADEPIHLILEKIHLNDLTVFPSKSDLKEMRALIMTGMGIHARRVEIQGYTFFVSDQRLYRFLDRLSRGERIEEDLIELAPKAIGSSGFVNLCRYAALGSEEPARRLFRYQAMQSFAHTPTIAVLRKVGSKDFDIEFYVKSKDTGRRFMVSKYPFVRKGKLLIDKRELLMPFSALPRMREYFSGILLGNLPAVLRKVTKKRGTEWGIFKENKVYFWGHNWIKIPVNLRNEDLLLTVEEDEKKNWKATLWLPATRERPQIFVGAITLYKKRGKFAKGYSKAVPYEGYKHVKGKMPKPSTRSKTAAKDMQNIDWVARRKGRRPRFDIVNIENRRDTSLWSHKGIMQQPYLGPDFDEGTTLRYWWEFDIPGFSDAAGVVYWNEITEAELSYLVYYDDQYREPELLDLAGSRTAGSRAAVMPSRRGEMEDLITRVKKGLKTMTVEAMPPKFKNLNAMYRYRKEIALFQDLLERGFIDGVTISDRPDFTRLTTLFVKALRPFLPPSYKTLATEIGSFEDVTRLPDVTKMPFGYIATIAAQRRSTDTIRENILRAVHEQGAQVLFLVTGGDPLIRLFRHTFGRKADEKFKWLYPMNTLSMIQMVKQLKAEGLIPEDIQIWVAWDWQKEPFGADGTPDYEKGLRSLEAKIRAGADVILTQPPFLQDRYMRWHEEAVKRGLIWSGDGQEDVIERNGFSPAQLKIGVPYITSPRNLIFWFRLMGVDFKKDPEAKRLLKEWQRAEKEGRLTRFRNQWNRNFLDWAYHLPPATGCHYMPTFGWKRSEDLLKGAGLSPKNRLLEDLSIVAQREVFHPLVRDSLRLDEPVRVNFARLLQSPELTPKAKKMGEGPSFFDEARPRVELAQKVLQEMQGTHPQFFERLWLYFYRSSQSNLRRPISYRSADTGWHEIAIDVRLASKDGFEEELTADIGTFAEHGIEEPDAVNLDPDWVPDEESAYHLFSQHTYDEDYEAFLKATSKATGLAATDLNENFVDYGVRDFLERLDLTKNKTPAYMEVGVAGALRAEKFFEGIRKVLNEMEDVGKAGRLREKLKTVTYVFADFSNSLLGNAREKYGDVIEDLGIKCRYIQVDFRDPERKLEEEGFGADFIIIHSTNLLDALPTNFIAKYEGEIFSVPTQSYVSQSALKALETLYGEFGVTAEKLREGLAKVKETGVKAFYDEFRGPEEDRKMPDKEFHQFRRALFQKIQTRNGYQY